MKENEAVFRKLLGNTPQGKASFETLLLDPGGVFIDPKELGEGRIRTAIFNAKSAKNGCADRMKRIVEVAPVIGDAKTEIIAGRKWETVYSSAERSLAFHRCERGVYWFLVFTDSKAPNRLALFAWAKPSVESAE